ncbi:hypothetical protein [Dechloromonas sp. H13]|uniref:hypothetical protein n=1 Tax=Dechloromonas sp. H13 TaxID=2570193 RepID=UPI0012909494|nr:hypothetical protein [Dechloromonas sp. H13]
MTIRQVSYTSRLQAEALAASPHVAVISITDPGTPEASLDAGFSDVLRLAFFDALPADEYLPAPLPGLFDHQMARQIGDFVRELHAAPADVSLVVHCEYGVSRSAAVALFAAAHAGAPLAAREFAYDANHWVVELLSRLYPELSLDIPAREGASERRAVPRVA